MTMTMTTMTTTMTMMTTTEAAINAGGARLLVVEDDRLLRELLREQLTLAGYRPRLAADLASATDALAETDFDLVLLDLNLPDGDGIGLARALSGSGVSVLMVTARDDLESRVEGLYAGASDYLVKPFSIEELLARVHVRLRERGASATLRYESLELDVARGACTVGEETFFLPERELDVLRLLLQYRGRVFTQDDLERAIYGAGVPGSNTIEVYVHNLRRKLKERGLDNVIVTVRNRGYAIV